MHEFLFAEGFPGKQEEAVLSICYIENVSLYRYTRKNLKSGTSCYVMFNKRVGVFYHNIKHDA
jgi:hypothetical protein